MTGQVWLTLVSILLCQGHLVVAVHADMSVVGGTSAIKPFELGQRWVYDHEGPRPQAMEPNAIDGQRILQVVSRDDRSGQAVWGIQERFTGDPNAVGRLYVDDERRLRSIEVINEKGEGTRLIYEPSIAYQAMAMQVGGQTVVKTLLRTRDGKFKIPIQMGVRRLEDETVVTAAGRFEGCRHFEFVTKSTIDLKLMKIPMQETHHRWYSDQVNGLVKEVYEKAPGKFMTWSWKGYTATSTLVSFGTAEIDQKAVQDVESTSVDTDHTPDTEPNRPAHSVRRLAILGALFAAVCSLVIVRGVRRRK
jgi:hypothetical protein